MNLNNELDFIQLHTSFSSGYLLTNATLLDTSAFRLDAATHGNLLGVLALISYILTLLPTTLRVVFTSTKKSKFTKHLYTYRRQIGIASFIFTVGHAWVLVKKRNFDFLDVETYWQYITGVSTFILFTVLTITSNDYSVKKIGTKNWKSLHQLTYIAMFILVIHIWYTMAGDWSYLTPMGLITIIGITLLYIVRLWIEHKNIQKNKEK